MLERYLLPLGPYILVAAGCIACLFVFLSLKKEIHRLKCRLDKQQEDSKTAAEELNARLEAIDARLRETEERAGAMVPPTSPKSGLNFSKRSQVIRLSRRGEQPENIATLLSLPRKEVELVLKVHGLVLNSSTNPPQ